MKLRKSRAAAKIKAICGDSVLTDGLEARVRDTQTIYSTRHERIIEGTAKKKVIEWSRAVGS